MALDRTRGRNSGGILILPDCPRGTYGLFPNSTRQRACRHGPAEFNRKKRHFLLPPRNARGSASAGMYKTEDSKMRCHLQPQQNFCGNLGTARQSRLRFRARFRLWIYRSAADSVSRKRTVPTGPDTSSLPNTTSINPDPAAQTADFYVSDNRTG